MIPEKFWLFAEKGRNLKNLPCIDRALFQHTKRVAYKDGHCWGQCLGWDDQDPSQIRGSLFLVYLTMSIKGIPGAVQS